MKPGDVLTFVKGVPTSEVVALWKDGHSNGNIRRRYPQLTWADVDLVVNAARYGHVRRGLAEGKTTAELAEELDVSSAAVWAIQKRAERNDIQRREWGGLSPRAALFLGRLGYKSLAETEKDPPTEEKVFMMKGVGACLFEEIRSVVPLKPGERPVEVLVRASAPPPPQSPSAAPPPQEPPIYVTKAAHYREALESPSAPESAKQLARFFDAVVKFGKMVPVDETLPSDIPCMAGPSPRRWCLGVVDIFWSTNPLGVCWECPVCKKQGIVTDIDITPAPPVEPGPEGRLQ